MQAKVDANNKTQPIVIIYIPVLYIQKTLTGLGF